MPLKVHTESSEAYLTKIANKCQPVVQNTWANFYKIPADEPTDTREADPDDSEEEDNYLCQDCWTPKYLELERIDGRYYVIGSFSVID